MQVRICTLHDWLPAQINGKMSPISRSVYLFRHRILQCFLLCINVHQCTLIGHFSVIPVLRSNLSIAFSNSQSVRIPCHQRNIRYQWAFSILYGNFGFRLSIGITSFLNVIFCCASMYSIGHFNGHILLLDIHTFSTCSQVLGLLLHLPLSTEKFQFLVLFLALPLFSPHRYVYFIKRPTEVSRPMPFSTHRFRGEPSNFTS